MTAAASHRLAAAGAAILGVIGLSMGLTFYRMGGVPLRTYRAGPITARVIGHLGQLRNLHTDPLSSLKIGSLEFSHLRGTLPFYVHLPNTNCIFFVTDQTGQCFHIVNLQNQEHMSFDASRLGGYGDWIGATNRELYETEELLSTDRLLLKQRGIGGFRGVYTLNLTESVIESFEEEQGPRLP